MIAPPEQSYASPTVLIVIVSYNSGTCLQRCLDSIETQTYSDWNAVVWDNASTDGSTAALRFGARTKLVSCPENLGFALANNRAAALSRSKFIVTLNPDAFAEADWLENLVFTARAFGVDSVASTQLSDRNPTLLDGAGDCMSIAGIAWRGGYGRSVRCIPNRPVEVFSACAAAALYSREAFERLGGFEERFFCYYEDVDFGFRLRLTGGRCVLAPTAIVRHVGSASSSKISGFAEYYGTRNRLWTFLRDMPAWLLPVALPAHFLVVAYVLFRSPNQRLRGIRWQGLKDGWRGRAPWLAERRSTPSWVDPRPFSWSPLALSQRSVKTMAIKRK